MNGSETSPALPDSGELREFLADYFQSNAAEIERLRDELHRFFCASATVSVPIERALATINREIALFARSTCGGGHDRTMQPLKNVVMMCCLDCYYPKTEPVVH